jgi:hypothetical protein
MEWEGIRNVEPKPEDLPVVYSCTLRGNRGSENSVVENAKIPQL